MCMKTIGKRCLMSFLTICLFVMSLQIDTKAAEPDGKLTGFSLTTSSEHANTPITKAQDQDTATFWESNWAGTDFTPTEDNPVVVTATFARPVEVGVMKITPRQGTDYVNNGDGNGRFKKVRYTKLDEVGNPIGEPFTETYVEGDDVPSPTPNEVSINAVVAAVKIEILSAHATTATMAELEFYAPKESNGIAAIEANTQQSANDQGIDKAFDQNEATFWHSAWNGFHVTADNPAIVTITRDNEEPMAELLYTTRPYAVDGDDNGNIKYMNIYTSTDQTNWTFLTDAHFDASAGTKRINMLGNQDPYVRLEIKEGVGNYASAAEFKLISLTSKDQIDASILDTVLALGLSQGSYKGWSADTAVRVLVAFENANSAYAGDDIALILQTLEELKTAYEGLRVDKQPLLDQIRKAQEVNLAGKHPSSVAALKEAIANALNVVETVTTPMEVAFEVTQLAEAMILSDEPIKDLQNVSDAASYERENNFNEGWLFKETNEDGSQPSLDESQYTSLNLPHDFSISKDFSVSGEAESGFLQGGTGWYRKHLILPEDVKGRSFQLVFDGAYMDTTVYVNGQKVGENHNGYNDFTFDITKYLVCDGISDNVISVQVINELPSSRWYSGSGLYRNVTLRMLNDIHIDDESVFIATPNVSAAQADIQITGTLSKASDTTTLQTTVKNANGEVVAQSEQVAPNDTKFSQQLTVTNPTLWSVHTDSPALYTVDIMLYEQGQLIDELHERIGFKTVEFSRDHGFFLNGENIKLKGVCMHHDQGALGAAENYHSVYRQMKIMKDMGVNSIRVTHAPASKVFMDVCDELGLLVINEAFDHLYYAKNNNHNDFARWFNVSVGEYGPLGSTPEMSWAEYVAKQMVKNSRNHASILMYSVGNELLEGGSSDNGYIQAVADACKWFKEMDPYHVPTIGDNKAKGNNALAVALCEEVHKAGGVIGFNYADQGQYDDLRTRHPEWILYGSETSSAQHSRNVYNVSYKDETKKLVSDYENEQAKAPWGHSASTAWKFVEENDWNLGEYVWTGFDYLGEPTPWNGIGTGSVSGIGPAPRSSFFGIVETTGFAKDIYYLYQSLWNDQVRTLHMSESWNEHLLMTNGKVMIQVFADADKVVLYKDGVEVASQTSTKKENGTRQFAGNQYFAEFKLAYEPGTMSVKAFDIVDGQEIEVKDTIGRNRISTTKKASKTALSADKTSLECDGYDLSYITVDVLDEAGNFVADYNQKLYFTLEGEGTIVGADNGNQSDTQSFRIDDPKRVTRNAFNGKALVIVQSSKRAGDIKLQVKGVGLETSSMTIHTSSSSASDTLKTLELVSKYTTLTNQEVDLPETITGIFSNGTSQELPVRWDLSHVDYSTPGTYTVKGYFEEYAASATVTIYVYHTFAGAQDYSTVMHEGSVIALPATRQVYYHDGSIAQEFPVTWGYFDESTFTAGNTYTIEGTVIAANVQLPVVAKIRVVEALPQSRNLARLESDMPALKESCTVPADNLASLNNGVIVSTSEHERWTDWNEQQNKKPWVSYEWQNEYMISDLVAYIYQDANSVVPRTLELEVDALNEKGEWIPQTVSYITPAAYNDGDGKTTINLKTPVKTKGIRLYLVKLEAGTFTGLTELEVFEYIPPVQPDNNVSITNVKINDEAVEGFDSNTKDYSILIDELPNLEAYTVNVEGLADTSTHLIIKDVYAHQIRIIVRAESGDEQVYTFTYQKRVSKTELQSLYDSYCNEAQGIYTDASWEDLQTALLEAKKVLEDESANEQSVQKATLMLQNAIARLTKQSADYSIVDEVLKKVPADLSIYTPESVSNLQQAIHAVEEGKKLDEQAIVNGYAKAIEEAIAKLVIRQGELKVDQLDPALASILLNSIPADLRKLIDEYTAQGIDVSMVVEVKAVDEAMVTAEMKKAMNALSKQLKLSVGAYYDLSISLQAKGEVIGQLRTLSDEIPMELVIPEALRKEGRKFTILRYHNETVDALPSTEEEHILKFTTDRFSIYAIAYERIEDIQPTPPIVNPEEPTPPVVDPEKPTPPSEDSEKPTPPAVNPEKPSLDPSIEPEQPIKDVTDPSNKDHPTPSQSVNQATTPNTGDSTIMSWYILFGLMAGVYVTYHIKHELEMKKKKQSHG